MNMVWKLVAVVASLGLTAMQQVVLAQPADAYPARSIRIIVPFPPGGATDLMTRAVAQKLNESWKKPVLVENKPGANGMLGADAVAKSQTDGYTYLAATIAHAANASLFPKAPYLFQKDLQASIKSGTLVRSMAHNMTVLQKYRGAMMEVITEFVNTPAMSAKDAAKQMADAVEAQK